MKSLSHSQEPTKLLHCLQGWPPPGPNHFRWEEDRLVYLVPLRGDETIVPTQSQWQEFWRICDEIDVWSWPPTLGDRKVWDGLEWILELEVGARRVISYGQVIGAPAGFKDKLMSLHRALQAMTGYPAD